jgi:hypothetical protein
MLNAIKKSVSGTVVTEVPSVVVPTPSERLQDDRVPDISFWAIEEPFVVNSAIPDDLKRNTGKAMPTKTSLNMFATFEEAAAYGQKMNKTFIIYEVKPSATVRPQLALVQKIDE